jgi:hypothetical protein
MGWLRLPLVANRSCFGARRFEGDSRAIQSQAALGDMPSVLGADQERALGVEGTTETEGERSLRRPLNSALIERPAAERLLHGGIADLSRAYFFGRSAALNTPFAPAWSARNMKSVTPISEAGVHWRRKTRAVCGRS